MTSSTYIARLMGPVLLIIGIGMAVGLMLEGEGYSSLLREFIGSRSLIFVTGILALVAGLVIVNTHNLWVQDWRVLVTVLGWLLVIRGVTLLVFPGIVQTLGDRVLASQAGIVAGAAFTFVIGAILCIKGYEDLWQQGPARRAVAAVAPAAARARSKKAPARKRGRKA